MTISMDLSCTQGYSDGDGAWSWAAMDFERDRESPRDFECDEDVACVGFLC